MRPAIARLEALTGLAAQQERGRPLRPSGPCATAAGARVARENATNASKAPTRDAWEMGASERGRSREELARSQEELGRTYARYARACPISCGCLRYGAALAQPRRGWLCPPGRGRKIILRYTTAGGVSHPLHDLPPARPPSAAPAASRNRVQRRRASRMHTLRVTSAGSLSQARATRAAGHRGRAIRAGRSCPRPGVWKKPERPSLLTLAASEPYRNRRLAFGLGGSGKLNVESVQAPLLCALQCHRRSDSSNARGARCFALCSKCRPGFSRAPYLHVREKVHDEVMPRHRAGIKYT